MENKEFFITQDGFKLHAKMDVPSVDKEKMPLVILIHGLTGHMEEEHIIGMKDAINDAGCISLRVELYGHGKSDGDFKNHNVSLWVNEILYIVDYVRTLSYVSDIYLCGHSQGGLSIILSAALKKEHIKGILPMAPAINIVDACKYGNFFGTVVNVEEIPDKLYLWDDKYVTGNYVRTGRILPIEDAICSFDKPVLLIHGTEDEAVPVSYALDAEKKFKDCELILIPGDNHCYNYHLDTVKENITKWLLKMEEK